MLNSRLKIIAQSLQDILIGGNIKWGAVYSESWAKGLNLNSQSNPYCVLVDSHTQLAFQMQV